MKLKCSSVNVKIQKNILIMFRKVDSQKLASLICLLMLFNFN
jgi:hypothetical protein